MFIRDLELREEGIRIYPKYGREMKAVKSEGGRGESTHLLTKSLSLGEQIGRLQAFTPRKPLTFLI